MKPHPELSPLRIARLTAALALAACLAACGPGTGGTGTGPGVSAGLAQGSYSGTLDPGALPPQLLPCGSHCGEQVALTVGTTRVELDMPCQRFVYEGSWSFDAQGQADLLGRWHQLTLVGGETTLVQQSVRLTLVASLPDDQGLRLQLTVTDLDGATLLGPLLVAQQGQASAAISCLLSYENK
ncbi:hypothetical protein [Pseudorhodoferax sp.]|uniref:hypothetical protein n=1 Tax=Pseudorhodoferax sp. TaxID=1993553 RepID=UPI002DD68523|nr:hypothetical protein [Pseudorhodoferax sp.]